MSELQAHVTNLIRAIALHKATTVTVVVPDLVRRDLWIKTLCESRAWDPGSVTVDGDNRVVLPHGVVITFKIPDKIQGVRCHSTHVVDEASYVKLDFLEKLRHYRSPR